MLTTTRHSSPPTSVPSSSARRSSCSSRTEITALEAEIVELAVGADLSMCRRLGLILAYDNSGGWAMHGATSCAVWLADACDIERSTAREQVRVARALDELPLIAGAFAAGELSYTKVRMLTREATPEDEHELLAIALECSGAQLAQRLAAHQGTVLTPEEIAARQHSRRSCSWRAEPDGTVSMSARLAPLQAARVQAAIEQTVMRTNPEREPDGSRPSLAQQSADALVALTTTPHDTGGGSSGVTAEVLVHLYARPDGGWELVTSDGTPIPGRVKFFV